MFIFSQSHAFPATAAKSVCSAAGKLFWTNGGFLYTWTPPDAPTLLCEFPSAFGLKVSDTHMFCIFKTYFIFMRHESLIQNKYDCAGEIEDFQCGGGHVAVVIAGEIQVFKVSSDSCTAAPFTNAPAPILKFWVSRDHVSLYTASKLYRVRIGSPECSVSDSFGALRLVCSPPDAAPDQPVVCVKESVSLMEPVSKVMVGRDNVWREVTVPLCTVDCVSVCMNFCVVSNRSCSRVFYFDLHVPAEIKCFHACGLVLGTFVFGKRVLVLVDKSEYIRGVSGMKLHGDLVHELCEYTYKEEKLCFEEKLGSNREQEFVLQMPKIGKISSQVESENNREIAKDSKSNSTLFESQVFSEFMETTRTRLSEIEEKQEKILYTLSLLCNKLL